MQRLKHFVGALALAVLSFSTFISCRTAESGGKWHTILDANHTNDWHMVGPGELKWEGGELVTYGGMGLLVYEKKPLGDCKIRVTFKLTDPKDNSGVFIRIAHPPKDAWDAVHHGYEVQICNIGDEWHRTGCLYSFTKAKNDIDAKVGEWNTMLITLKGKRTVVELNGGLITDFTEGDEVPPKHIWYEGDRGPRVDTGYIGLQNHGGDAHVHFKEVSVSPL